MSGRLTILCDLDSVIADLLGAWLPRYNAKHGRAFTVDQITEWDMHLCAPDGHRVYDTLHEEGLFRGLAPLAGAIAGMKALHDAGHQTIILTASAKQPQTAADKIAWVREHLPWLDRKSVLIGHRKELVRGDVLIDDSPENILAYRKAWPDAGIITIDYPYNRQPEVEKAITLRAHGHADTATAWKEIVRALPGVPRAAPSSPPTPEDRPADRPAAEKEK